MNFLGGDDDIDLDDASLFIEAAALAVDDSRTDRRALEASGEIVFGDDDGGRQVVGGELVLPSRKPGRGKGRRRAKKTSGERSRQMYEAHERTQVRQIGMGAVGAMGASDGRWARWWRLERHTLAGAKRAGQGGLRRGVGWNSIGGLVSFF